MIEQVTADRLLEAADRCVDRSGVANIHLVVSDEAGALAVEIGEHVAALLRAVAVTHGHYPGCSCAEFVAASELSDGILNA